MGIFDPKLEFIVDATTVETTPEKPIGRCVRDAKDAEIAELRAEVERLTHRVAKAEGSRDMALDAAKSRGARAEAAEAKVARVEALVDEWERDRDVCLAWIDNPEMHVDKEHPTRLSLQADSLNRRAVEIRAALDGDAIQAALDKVRRVIICSPDVADQLREEVEAEGLAGFVKVVSVDILGARTAYITRPGLLAEHLRTGAMGGYAGRWLADHNKEHPHG